MAARFHRLLCALLAAGLCASRPISAQEPAAPAILSSPASVSETAGGAAGFVVRAAGSPPLSYQWRRNGTALPGETSAELMRSRITPADAGAYSVVVTNGAGSVESGPATLVVSPAPTPVVDPSFRADAAIDFAPTLLLPLPDGRLVIVGGPEGRLRRLLPDGRLDASFDPPVFTGTDQRGTAPGIDPIACAALQSDGKIVIGGGFTAANGAAAPGLIRLNPDGSLDAGFVPAAGAISRSPRALAIQSDGRILLANSGDRAIRLLDDGRIDPDFSTAPLVLLDENGVSRPASVIGVAAGPDGIFAAAEYGAFFAPAGILISKGNVLKLDASGRQLAGYLAPSTRDRFLGMQPLDDGGLLLATRRAEFRRSATEVRRYKADGALDSTYPVVEAGLAQLFYPDGRMIWAGFDGPVRLTSAGTPDPSFTGGIGLATVVARADGGRVFVAGRFSAYNGTPANRVARLNAVPAEAANPPALLALVADKTTVRYGEPITVRAIVTGSGELTYGWYGPSVFSGQENGGPQTTKPTITFSFTATNDSRTLRLIVSNTRGRVESQPLQFEVLPDPPRILSQSTRVSAQTGRTVRLNIYRNATAHDVTFDWRRNGVPIETGPDLSVYRETLVLTNVTAADAGRYTLTLRNSLGETVTTTPIEVTIDDTSRFTNFSTRMRVDANEPAIAGFVVSGNSGRYVLVRAIGPALAAFGVSDPLADPKIVLYDSAGRTRLGSASDNWDPEASTEGIRLPAAFERTGAFPLPVGSKDAAFLSILGAGAYTVHLTGQPGQTGTALLEIYECDTDAATMRNLSTRARVGPGSPAIAGVSIRGPVPKKVLLRAVGPGLGAFGVASPLANPRLDLRNAAGATVSVNDDWDAQATSDEIRSVTTALGAFPLEPGSKDAALLVTLPPGNYTAVVDSENGAGTALIETYEVP